MLDKVYVEEIRALDNKESKNKLAEYGKEFGIDLKKTKSFDNMLADLEEELQKLANEPLPEGNGGLSISELIDAADKADGHLVLDETNEEASLLIGSIGNPVIQITEPLDMEVSEELKEKAAEHGLEVVVTDKLSDNTFEEAVEHIKQAEEKSMSKFQLPEGYGPKFTLIGRAPGYMTLPWWIYQWIEENEDWKDHPLDFAHPTAHDTLMTLIYYIQRDGSVTVRETRNSRFITLK